VKYSEHEDLNKFLTILASCDDSIEIEVEINTTMNIDDRNRIKELSNGDKFSISPNSKIEIINRIAANYQNAHFDDFCYHFFIYNDKKLIAVSYDNSCIVFLDSKYFKLSKEEELEMGDSEIHYQDAVTL
jgi:hypothetical protein